METGTTSSTETVAPALAAAFAAWMRFPGLAATLGDPGSAYLVLDAEDGRVLHAATAARPLADMLRASDGAALARQIAAAGVGRTGPQLARLRLDGRRITAPTLCLLARGTGDGGSPVILLAPAGPVALRARPPAPGPKAADLSDPIPGSSDPPPKTVQVQAVREGDRFLWRSDAAGTITSLTGVDGGFGSLVGRQFRDLAASGRLGGAEAMLAALQERRTFRAAPATLDVGGAGLAAVEVSGAPVGRGADGFAGFGGFGIVRRIVPRPESARIESASIETASAASPSAESAAPAPMSIAPASPQPSAASEDPAPAVPDAHAVTGIVDPALSIAEHAAFREIARALGARYAGDDEQDPPAGAVPLRQAGGSVTPFRSALAETALATPAAWGDARVLDALPVPVLIHRGDAILAANRPLLELAGFADLAALKGAGIDGLFRGLPPEDESSAGRTTAIATADGQARPVEVHRGPWTWAGTPATCLVLLRLQDEDPQRALAAERLAREVQAGRALGAEAALDAVAAGVVTIDDQGRVVALNRAAAALFASDPREIVGGDFVALLDADTNAVGVSLTGGGDVPQTVLVRGRRLILSLAPPRPDGHRVAVLHHAPEPAQDGPDEPADAGRDERGIFLARLDRDLRAPMSGIVALTDRMLTEPFGSLGDARYRDCLTDIKASGERILERLTELRELTAIEAGDIALDPRPFALNDVVAGCVARLQPEAARGRIVLRTSFSADLAELEADERSVRRAACLVIGNAIHRSTAGGQVIVSTDAAENADVALRVRDAGAAGTRPDIGPPQAQDAGLRLALPRALIEANGGRLHLTGRGDEGILVEIILPARGGGRP